jgi:uncharacterized protein HemY
VVAPDERYLLLTQMVSHMPSTCLPLAARMAGAMVCHADRAWILAEVAARAPDPYKNSLIEMALQAAKAVGYLADDAWILLEVASQASEFAFHTREDEERWWNEAMAAAKEIEDHQERARLLIEIASRAPEWLHSDVVDELSLLRGDLNRARALIELAARLRPGAVDVVPRTR